MPFRRIDDCPDALAGFAVASNYGKSASACGRNKIEFQEMHPATEISTIPWPHGERLRSINRCSAVRNQAFPGTANYVKSFLGLY